MVRRRKPLMAKGSTVITWTAGESFTSMSIFFIIHKIEEEKNLCAADFSLLNLPKGKSLGRSKPATNS